MRHRPPSEARDRPAYRQPTWRNILVSYAMLAAIPVLLWVSVQPLTRLSLVGVLVAGALVARRLHALASCLAECRALAFDLGGAVTVTISRRGSCCTP